MHCFDRYHDAFRQYMRSILGCSEAGLLVGELILALISIPPLPSFLFLGVFLQCFQIYNAELLKFLFGYTSIREVGHGTIGRNNKPPP